MEAPPLKQSHSVEIAPYVLARAMWMDNNPGPRERQSNKIGGCW